MKTKWQFVAILLLLSLKVGYTQSLNQAKLDLFFDQLEAKQQAMGSLTIAQDGNILYSRSIGYSQISEAGNKQITSATRFRIASIKKMYTAVMIYQLVEEGKLKLTDHLDQFFPQIANAQKITIGLMLGHRAGIHDSMLDPDLRPSSLSKTDAVTKEEVLDLIAKGPSDFEPDTDHKYTNAGYFLLGLIIEKVSGKSWEENLNERIVSRLDLKDTYMTFENIDVNRNEALTYRNLGGWKQQLETHPSISGGTLVQTPGDMARFIQALFNGKLISGEHLTRMSTQRDGEGMGMTSFSFAGKTFYGETGGGDNYGTWLAYLPEEKLVLSYATNAKVYPVKNIMEGVAKIYYNQPFEIPTFDAFQVRHELLDQYAGTYAAVGPPVKMTITVKGEIVYIQPGGESSATPLKATAEDTFTIEGAGVVFQFDPDKKEMIMKRQGGEMIFRKEN